MGESLWTGFLTYTIRVDKMGTPTENYSCFLSEQWGKYGRIPKFAIKYIGFYSTSKGLRLPELI